MKILSNKDEKESEEEINAKLLVSKFPQVTSLPVDLLPIDKKVRMC
jgi:hypothetical protein